MEVSIPTQPSRRSFAAIRIQDPSYSCDPFVVATALFRRGILSPLRGSCPKTPKPSAHALGYLLPVLRTSTPAWTARAPSRPLLRVFASTNELSTCSLRPSRKIAGRVPSPGVCIEDRRRAVDRQFIAAKHPFRRGSVLRVSPHPLHPKAQAQVHPLPLCARTPPLGAS